MKGLFGMAVWGLEMQLTWGGETIHCYKLPNYRPRAWRKLKGGMCMSWWISCYTWKQKESSEPRNEYFCSCLGPRCVIRTKTSDSKTSKARWLPALLTQLYNSELSKRCACWSCSARNHPKHRKIGDPTPALKEMTNRGGEEASWWTGVPPQQSSNAGLHRCW